MDDYSAHLKSLEAWGLAGVGFYEWRIDTDTVTWSRGMLEIFGVTEAPRAERGFTRMVHPDDRVRVEAETSAYMETGAPYDHEFRVIRPDGTVRVVHDRGLVERDASGRVVAMRGVNVDVTAHRTAEAAPLAEPGVARYDFDVARRLSWWSPEAFRLFSLPPANAVSSQDVVRRRVHEDDAARVLEAFDGACRRIGRYRIAYCIRREDGVVRHIVDAGETIGPIDPATGLARRARGTLTDVTDRVAEAEDRSLPARESFRQLVEGSPTGIYTVDGSLRIAHASESARRAFAGVQELIGCELETALRVIWPEAIATEVVARFRETLATGRPYAAPPLVERRADIGEIEAYDWKLERITMPDGRPGVVCNFYDLSAREAEAAALRETAERLELAHEAGGMGAWDLDLRTDAAVWTPQMRRLIGIGEDVAPSAAVFFERVHPDDRPGLVDRFQEAVRTGGDMDAEFRIVRPDGAVRVLVGRGRTIEHDAEGPTRMIGINYDVTERRQAERRLKESEARLRLVLDNSIAFMAVLDPDGTMREVNARALEAGGLTRDEVIGRPFAETPWWSHDAEGRARLRDAIAAVRGGETARYDAVVRMRDDTRMTVDMMLAPITDDAGRTTQIVASGLDVTDREAASEHARMLMREINHRSKNLLTVVQIIARRTRAGDPATFQQRFERRLVALSAAQDLLVHDDWDGAWLGDLVRSQLGHFADLIGTRIIVRGPDIRLDPAAAQQIGMVFHELATNAGKHGSLSVETGTVTLDWSVLEDVGDGPRLALEWVETGGPPVTAPTETGFGTIVIDRMLRDSLSAQVRVDYVRSGFRWRAVCGTGFSAA